MIGPVIHKLRLGFWSLFYRTFGRFAFYKLGPGVRFEGWVDIPQSGGRISIGRGVHVCRLVEFSVPPGGELVLKDKAFVGRGVVISAHRRVVVGEHTMIGEYVSIHDNDHRMDDARVPVSERGFISFSLDVGSNCWIGARAVLVRGSGMGDDCVLGAGAVLTRSIPSGSVAVGVPAKPIVRQTPGLAVANE